MILYRTFSPQFLDCFYFQIATWGILIGSLSILNTTFAAQPPNTSGQTGLVNMPNAYLEDDGVWRMGFSRLAPYSVLWSSITALPRVELSARFTSIDDVAGFASGNYGDYKDKAFDAKVQLFNEGDYAPALALGYMDAIGTRLFAAEYAALSKTIGVAELTVGAGTKRIEGFFGGARIKISPSSPWAFVVERDVTRYDQDIGAMKSGASGRMNKPAIALEYRYGWLAATVLRQDEEWGANLFVSVPLSMPEFIPKLDEPQPIPAVLADAAPIEKTDFSGIQRHLIKDGYQNIELTGNPDRVHLHIAHPRISQPGRVVGRAARVLDRYSVDSVSGFHITLAESELPLLEYVVSDRNKMRQFFRFEKEWVDLESSLAVSQPLKEQPTALILPSGVVTPDSSASTKPKVEITGEEGHFVALKQEDSLRNSWRIIPFNLSVFFNDPSGAFHYDIFATAALERRLHPGVTFKGALRLTLIEDVSEVTQASNSLLPHVRTDVAQYKKEGPLKLDSAWVNKLIHVDRATYGRFTVGLYEEMFGGAGGQLLYYDATKSWAIDLTVDQLYQREIGGTLKFRDYSVLSSLLAIHYRLPFYQINTTARVGRFLAKDDGARLEVSRTFGSGVELGAWYTVTNGNDITTPGQPDDPYFDKGLFVSIPLRSMLTKDTRAAPRMALAPWTRDVGQIVKSPGDLFQIVNSRVRAGAEGSDPRYYFGQ